MARNHIFSRRRRSDQLDGLDRFPTSDSEVHVLAVDDSLVDRTVIERLLRLTACRGLPFFLLPLFYFPLFFFLWKFILSSVLGFTVTAVDSGIRALQYLGLQDETNSQVGFDVSTLEISCCFFFFSFSCRLSFRIFS